MRLVASCLADMRDTGEREENNMAFCKECLHWRKTTYDPKNEHIGTCQIDGKEKEDSQYGCIFIEKRRPLVGTLNLDGRKVR